MAVDKRSARLGVLATVSLLLLGLLGTRLWFLQGVRADYYQKKVTAAKTKTVYIPAERGRILDAKGRVLADNQRILTVAVDWSVIRNEKNRRDLFTRLSNPLKVPVDDLMRRYEPCYPRKPPCGKAQLYDTLLPLPLKEDVDESTVMFLKERSEDYPGVDVREDWRREYPYAPIASHVIGFLGAIPDSTTAAVYYKTLGYDPDARIGRFGVEQTYENDLRGKPGFVKYEVDSRGRIIRQLSRQEAVPGNDIQLSIDIDMQQFTEQALYTELDARRHTDAPTILKFGEPDPAYPLVNLYKAPAGSSVVLNHDTGEILAMASYPNFDNRWFNAGISSEKFNQLFPNTKDPDQSILVNRAVSGRYNLGSSFKPFVAYAALNTGQLPGGVDYTLKDTGTYKLTSIPEERCQLNVKCIFKNANCGNGAPCRYGRVNVVSALAISSDVFFYKIGEEIFSQRGYRPILEEQVRQFGFGSPTGIDLPYEFIGTVPNKALKQRLAASGAIAKEEGKGYYVGDNVQFAIGQGLLSATPLQLAVAYGTIANGGKVLQPHVVRAVWGPGTPNGKPGRVDMDKGVVLRDFSTPVVKRDIGMDMQARDAIVEGLTRVVNGPGVRSDIYHATTGEKLFRSYPKRALPIAGKTGTAQNVVIGKERLKEEQMPWEARDHAWFASFAPAEDPELVVVVINEHGGHGGSDAAPAAAAASAMGVTSERTPVECEGSTITGRRQRSLTQAMPARSSVLRRVLSKLRFQIELPAVVAFG